MLLAALYNDYADEDIPDVDQYIPDVDPSEVSMEEQPADEPAVEEQPADEPVCMEEQPADEPLQHPGRFRATNRPAAPTCCGSCAVQHCDSEPPACCGAVARHK